MHQAFTLPSLLHRAGNNIQATQRPTTPVVGRRAGRGTVGWGGVRAEHGPERPCRRKEGRGEAEHTSHCSSPVNSMSRDRERVAHTLAYPVHTHTRCTARPDLTRAVTQGPAGWTAKGTPPRRVMSAHCGGVVEQCKPWVGARQEHTGASQIAAVYLTFRRAFPACPRDEWERDVVWHSFLR